MAQPSHRRTLKAFGTRDEKDVLEVVRDPESDVRFIRLIFPDILGRQMDFSIPASELASAFKEGKGFDGSSVAGFVRIEEVRPCHEARPADVPGPSLDFTKASPATSAGARGHHVRRDPDTRRRRL